ncbi:MAG TPA: DUF5677 domain-containing protein [Thermodesulfovibrionales bacterium]|nr:DUF5677 domain-containing protein [Thermodesulfovibrionales bacterium]
MTPEEAKWMEQIMSLMRRYCEVVKTGLVARWDKLDVKIYDSETYEVIGGLLSRQATLTTELALSPSIWNGHIGPLVLRCMTDAHITLAWILRYSKERAKKYILYGLGQEKLYIEYLKAEYDSSTEKDERIKQMIEFKEKWLNAQRHDFLTEVNVGSWAGHNTREMAEEADCESLYRYAYVPFSGAAHNMWQHISLYNLKQCKNPLHKYHRVPTIIDPPIDPDFVYRSAKYVSKSYVLFDETLKIKIDTPLPVDWFVDEFDKLHENEKENASQ